MIYLRSQRYLVLSALFLLPSLAQAGDLVTRVYELKNADVSNVIQVVNFSIANPTGRRILAGQAKHFVVTDAVEQQGDIAELLPIVDISSTQTDPRKIQMEMLVQASRYLQQKKKSQQMAQSPTPASVAAPHFTAAKPYKSIYSEEDAKITRAPRVIRDEPEILSLSALTLKGVFMANTASPLALLAWEGNTYTARDGGLFQSNRHRVKDVTSQVHKDHVILMGLDHRPVKIQFKSTL